MSRRSFKLLSLLLAPAMSLALLGGIATEHRRYLKPADFEPYHVRAKEAIESLPLMIGSWNGFDADEEVPKEAQVLLKPNRILMRRYTDTSVASLTRPRQVSLLIVQCKLSGDMVGHFPPICYPSHGYELVAKAARDWKIGTMSIPGMEYQFTKNNDGRPERSIIYNFFVVPTRGLARDIDGVKAAAEDYQQRYYGAAQFQVQFSSRVDGDLPQSERDEIFTTLMEKAVPVIEQLNRGEIQ
jgi:hypothetical protein